MISEFLTLQFDDFLLKPRIDYLPSCVLSRCYWTTSSSSAYNGIIGQQFGSCSDIKNCTEYQKKYVNFYFFINHYPKLQSQNQIDLAKVHCFNNFFVMKKVSEID